jgi:hypothetical protein
MNRVLLGTICALMLGSAAEAAVLTVYASGSISGTDTAGLLGAAGEVYDSDLFTLSATLDLANATGSDNLALQEYVFAYNPPLGLATVNAGGNLTSWGTAFTGVQLNWNAVVSELQMPFQNTLGSSYVQLDVQTNSVFTSIADIPSGNLWS